MVEQHNLLLELQSSIVSFEELWILFLQLLPYKTSKARFNLSLILQRGYHLALVHVKLEAPFYQILNQLNVFTRYLPSLIGRSWSRIGIVARRN